MSGQKMSVEMNSYAFFKLCKLSLKILIEITVTFTEYFFRFLVNKL